MRAFKTACANGDLDVAKQLIEQDGVDPTAKHNYAIRLACENGHLDVVKLLLEQDGVDPTAACNYATADCASPCGCRDQSEYSDEGRRRRSLLTRSSHPAARSCERALAILHYRAVQVAAALLRARPELAVPDVDVALRCRQRPEK